MRIQIVMQFVWHHKFVGNPTLSGVSPSSGITNLCRHKFAVHHRLSGILVSSGITSLYGATNCFCPLRSTFHSTESRNRFRSGTHVSLSRLSVIHHISEITRDLFSNLLISENAIISSYTHLVSGTGLGYSWWWGCWFVCYADCWRERSTRISPINYVFIQSFSISDLSFFSWSLQISFAGSKSQGVERWAPAATRS